MAKTCTLPIAVKQMAAGAKLTVEETIDGRVKIMARGSRALIGIASSEAEAKALIEGFVGQNMKDLSGGLSIPALGTSLSQPPLPPQSVLSSIDKAVRKGVSALQFAGAVFTPFGKWAEAAERLGKGPIASKIFKPTQDASGRYRAAMGATNRPGLKSLFNGKDKSFSEAAKQIDAAQVNLDPEQRRLVTLWNEARTKNELIAPGALLEDGMDAANIAVADVFSKFGIAHEIPNMLRRNAVIDDFLANRQDMLQNQIPLMQLAIKEKRLPAEFAEELEALVRAAGVDDSPEAVMKAMGLTVDEQKGMFLLRNMLDDEVFNIPAIYRYATAPELKAGFKTGFEQFAHDRGMTAEAVKLAKQRQSFLNTVFSEDVGFQAQVLGAQLPIFRQFISAGLMPGKQFGQSSRSAVQKWASVLRDLPEGTEILSRRVLSGSLNPNELNPAVSAFKHARNILYREHMDPVMKEATEAVTQMAKNSQFDTRVGQLTLNYLHELEGLPTESFKQLNAMIRSVARSFNVGVSDRIAEKWVNTLNTLTYSSSIPFRIGLIARNSFQTMLVVPIVGAEAWYHGMKTTLGWAGKGFDQQLAQDAMQRAIKSNALKVDVIPLHGGTELFSGVSEGMFGNWRPEFAKVGYKVKEVFDMGFTAYRKPDDVGRVVAFEAGRFRVNRALSNYQRLPGPDAVIQTGKNKGRTALDVLKREGKIKTFDETIEAEFEVLIRADRFDDASNLIGAKLADKVHFLYADANHPSGWGGVGGKLLGQFGTFPVQYVQHVLESATRGTVKDRVEFLAGHSAINLGIISAGAKLFDADLESWAFAPSIHYTGGPYAEMILSGVAAWSGSEAEQSLAKNNLKMMLPWWNRPSILVPGSYFVSDVIRGTQEDGFARMITRASGIKFLDGEPSATENLFDNVKDGFGWINEMLP